MIEPRTERIKSSRSDKHWHEWDHHHQQDYQVDNERIKRYLPESLDKCNETRYNTFSDKIIFRQGY